MKILQLCTRFFPSPGGVETFVLEVSKELKKRGNLVSVYTTDLYTETPFVKLQEYLPIVKGIPVRRFTAYSLGGELHYVISPKMLFSTLTTDADILHAHSYGYFQTHVASFVKKIKHRIFVYSTHYHPEWSMMGGWKRKKLRAIYDKFFAQSVINTADKIIVESREEINLLKRYFKLSENKIKVIPPGIDFSKFSLPPNGKLFRKKYNIEDRIVLFSGRLAVNKGLENLIECIPRVVKEFTDVKFVFVGEDYGMKDILLQKAKWHNVEDKILFTGHISDEKLFLSAYGACDIFVLPSEYEAFGLVLLEAMAAGKPCIGTKTGGIPDIIVHGKTGLLVDYGDKHALADRICELLLDECRRREMGIAGRERVKNYFTWERVATTLESLYIKLSGL